MTLRNPETCFATQTVTAKIENTVYQNLTSKPILIVVTVSCNLNGYSRAYTDSAVNPTTLVAETTNGNAVAFRATMTFVVTPGNYYKVLDNAASITKWVEYG